MKFGFLKSCCLTLLVANGLAFSAQAGKYAAITIDGSFSDWAGVPVAYSQPQDSTTTVAFQSISLANDDNYLYVLLSIYPPANNPFTSPTNYLNNIYIDADNNDSTGYVPFDGITGSEAAYADFGSDMLIESGTGYQETAGTFNAGAINGLGWQVSPATNNTEFEFRISRNATYASSGLPVFSSGTIAIALESENAGFDGVEFAPTNGNGGIVYTFASNSSGSTAPSLLDPAQPFNQSVVVSNPVPFTVVAGGTAPLFYQWYKGASPIANATNAIYTNLIAQLGDNGATYYCHITNSAGSTNSRVATLTVSTITNVSTFKTIAVDGSFSDWAGVPLAFTQPEISPTAVAYQNIYLCNDSNNLYIRFTIYPPTNNPFGNMENIYVNADNDTTSGYVPFDDATASSYANFSSEMLIQQGAGYQQASGTFNAGTINGLNWSNAPATGTNFEMSISLGATYASSGLPVFTGKTFAIAFEAEDTGFNPIEYAPANGGGIVYTIATNSAVAPPGPLSVSKSGGNAVISWPGAATLQSAGSVSNGVTWTNVTTISPYNAPVAGKSQQYFRLVK